MLILDQTYLLWKSDETSAILQHVDEPVIATGA